MHEDPRRFAPATARNREPILEVLRRHVGPGADVLEIASGSGEHAIFLAPALAVASWQPSDPSPESRASIDAWRRAEGAATVLPAIDLDVTGAWPKLAPAPTVVVCVNMIHIAPWEACLGVLDGAGRVLPEGGVLFLYGPYKRGGRHTAPSNEAFDASLRGRNQAWGVRDLDDVAREAGARGLDLAETAPMPVNNLSVVFRRRRR